MARVDPVIERIPANFEHRAEDERRRMASSETGLDGLLLSVGREAGVPHYLVATGRKR